MIPGLADDPGEEAEAVEALPSLNVARVLFLLGWPESYPSIHVEERTVMAFLPK